MMPFDSDFCDDTPCLESMDEAEDAVMFKGQGLTTVIRSMTDQIVERESLPTQTEDDRP